MGAMEDGWKRVVRALQEYTTPIGQTELTTPSVTSCTLADTWYSVAGTFDDETEINNGFIMTDGGLQSNTSCKATFGGSGNFRVSAACQIIIGLFVNGVNVAKANTVINYTAANRILPASRTVAIPIAIDDVFDLRIMSDTAGVDVTISELNALFIGLRS